MNGYPEAPIEISDSSSRNDEDDMDSETIYEEDGLNEIKKDLLRCLDKIQTTGHVAVSKQHEAFANPGLTVADSLIPLPLVPRDAETIRSVSREAPFGKADKTVVDTSVRKTWELDHTQFTFANPAWQAYVASLLDDAARSLAMSEVRAEPYKLLLYEEGSFFKRHKDSEKAPGMIGTMVICLPSKHDGGSVHLSHTGKSYVFETDKTSDFGLTSLSWFSDVTHEIKPLKSGYRLVLTYNIIHTGHKHMSAGLVGKQSEHLRSVLVKWQSKLPFRDKLVYMLEHKYTKSSLKLSNLKGRDRAICQSLYEVGLSCGFTIFLAKMTRTIHGEEYYEYDATEESTELEDVRTCDGLTVCNMMYLEDEDILGSDLWDRDADSQDEGDFTGNESMPSILRYHDTVVVIVPMSKMPSFLPKPGLRTALSLASHTLEHGPDDHRLQASLLKILESAIPSGFPDGALLSNVINLAVKLQRKTLYEVAVRTALNYSAPRQQVLETIVRLMKDDHLKDTQKQPDWDYWFGDAFSGAGNISLVILADVLNRLDALIQGDDLKVSFQSWRTSMSEKMIESKPTLGMEDHDYLICLLFSKSDDLVWLTNWFAPTLSSKGPNQLIYTILRDIYNNRERKTLARATDAYQCILENSTEKLALRTSNFPVSYFHTSLGENTPRFNQAIEIISLGLDMGLSKAAIKLLETSCTNIRQSSLELKEKNVNASTIQSFLKALLAVLQKHKVPPLECVKDMFAVLFRDFFIGRLPKRPTKSQGWKHKPVNCYMTCQDCRELNAFLENSEEKEREFTMVTKQRQHLENKLSKKLFHCRTRTGRAPYGLVVTKLGKEFEEDMKECQHRLTLLKNELQPFKCEYMQSLLGEELYQELVLLKDASDADGAGTAETVGRKRKADEDLDGSSASRPRLVE